MSTNVTMGGGGVATGGRIRPGGDSGIGRVRRGAAMFGGLAVLLAGVALGVADPATAVGVATPSTSVSSTSSTSLAVTSARDTIGPVARTGGER